MDITFLYVPIRDGEGQVIQSWVSQKLELPLQGNWDTFWDMENKVFAVKNQ